MEALFFVPQYARWHYTRGVRDFFRNWMDFLWFLSQFFSLGILFKTLFVPWERMSERYNNGFNLEAIASTVIVNTIMRGVGFIIRLTVLILGFASLIFVILGGFVLFICWLFFPVILFFLMALSVRYVFI